MIPALLAEIGLPILLGVAKKGLEKLDGSVAKGAVDALGEVEKAMQTGDITQDDLKIAQQHIETMREYEIREFEVLIKEINESLRAEVYSSDQYVRRMRPTFGYIMAITWAAQMLAVAFVIVDTPEMSGQVIASMASLSTIWTVGLSVLGVYVYKRSEDKKNKKDEQINPLATIVRRLKDRLR